MDGARQKARLDWLAELGGALALAIASGFAALKLAPSLGWTAATAMTASGVAAFSAGLLLMRAVKAEPRTLALPSFAVEPIEAGPYEVPLLLEDLAQDDVLLLEDLAEDEVLLLDDRLVEADADSRIVQLFASPSLTPGQMKERIDRHLAAGAMHVVHEFEGPAPDASDALYAALAELRRSLR